jgi:hypothetical protein
MALANLVAGLESTLAFAAGTSDRLKVHVDRIDQRIAAASQEQQHRQIFHGIIPTVDVGSATNSHTTALVRSNKHTRC